MAMNRLMVKPRPQLRGKLVGYGEDRVRMPYYLGINGVKRTPVYIMFPTDRAFLASVLLYGPPCSGKSVVTRNIIENAYLEWRRFRHVRLPTRQEIIDKIPLDSEGKVVISDRWRHPIIIFDSKLNSSGLDKPNSRDRDRYLLRTLHKEWADKFVYVPRDKIHIYMPAYVAPSDRETVLKVMNKKWGAEGLWGVPWRHVTDLAHLATVLKVPEATLWAEELRPTFEKCSANPTLTLKDLLNSTDGILTNAAEAIPNKASQTAALSFVRRWRKNKFWFANKDQLAKHIEDPFSINVLTFVETPEKVYFNQLSLLIALESLMAHLQESKTECQPIVIIHDILNFIGEDKPFRSQIIDALRRLIIGGQARTMSHGMIVVIETQSLDLPKDLGNPLRYTVHVKMKWKSSSDSLRKVPGFIGGICDVHDHFNNFHSESVITRPPLTSYSV